AAALASLLSAAPPLLVTQGVSFTAPVASFTAPFPNATPGQFSATIDWGDRTSSPGVITQPNGPGTLFVVLGTHTFGQQTTELTGLFQVRTTVTDNLGVSKAATTQAQVLETFPAGVDTPNEKLVNEFF